MRRVVVLPQPDGPSRVTNSPDDEIAAVVNYVFVLIGAKTMVNSADITRIRGQSTGHDELKRIRSGLP